MLHSLKSSRAIAQRFDGEWRNTGGGKGAFEWPLDPWQGAAGCTMGWLSCRVGRIIYAMAKSPRSLPLALAIQALPPFGLRWLARPSGRHRFHNVELCDKRSRSSVEPTFAQASFLTIDSSAGCAYALPAGRHSGIRCPLFPTLS
jgi:hypothetical protein